MTLSLSDDMGSVMDLDLMVIREDMARQLEKRFLDAPERMYSEIMRVLLSSDGQDGKK